MGLSRNVLCQYLSELHATYMPSMAVDICLISSTLCIALICNNVSKH